LESLPNFQSVLQQFQCPLQAVRLMRLAAGSQIHEHRDHDLAAETGMARLHIPVVTNDRVDFRLNGTRVVMQPGECWYLRLSDPHSVDNQGEHDRIHLVLDAEVNDWLRELLLAGQNGADIQPGEPKP
jgi:aspartyl/asparaginyl beta-hydroxylase (cupin superfamily)